MSNWCRNLMKWKNANNACEWKRHQLFMTLTANGLSTAGSPNGLSSKFDMIFYADCNCFWLNDALATRFTYLVSFTSVYTDYKCYLLLSFQLYRINLIKEIYRTATHYTQFIPYFPYSYTSTGDSSLWQPKCTVMEFS